MKPRIYRQHGLWYCCTRAPVSAHYNSVFYKTLCGVGYDQRQAYLDWANQAGAVAMGVAQ